MSPDSIDPAGARARPDWRNMDSTQNDTPATTAKPTHGRTGLLEAARAHHEEKPTARLMVYLAPSLKSRIERLALDLRVPQAAIVRVFIETGLDAAGG